MYSLNLSQNLFKNKHFNFILLISLLYFIGIAKSDFNCKAGDFPKIFGGKIGDTNITQMEYHDEAELLCVCGLTSDRDLTRGATSNSTALPFILCYQGDPNYQYKWGKYIEEAYNQVDNGIAFNINGSLAITIYGQTLPYPYISKLAVWNTSNGVLINARTIDTQDYQSLYRNILIDSSNCAYIVCRKKSTGTYHYQLQKIKLISPSELLIWGKLFASTFSTIKGLVFGETENEIYFLADSGTQFNYILVFSSLTGETIKQYSTGIWRWTNLRFILLTKQTQMIVGSVQKSSGENPIQFAKIILENGTMNDSIFYHSITFQYSQIRDLKIINKDNIIGLIMMRNSEPNFSILLALVSFSMNQVTFKYTVQFSITDTISFDLGRFVYKTNFLISGKAKQLNNKHIQQNWTVYQGIILSSYDRARSCVSLNDDMDFPIPSIISSLNITLNAVTEKSPSTFNNFGTYYVSLYTPTKVQSLNMAALSQALLCFRENPTQYLITVPQTQTYYTFTEGYAHLIDIEPFTASIICGNTPAVFTYTGVTADLYGTPLPSFITIESSTGTIQIAATSIASNNIIKIIGELENDQKKIQTYSLTITPKQSMGLSNQPPRFIADLESLTVSLNSILTYELPLITDYENDSVTLTTYQYGDSYLPSFIIFDVSRKLYKFNPTEFKDVGTTALRVKLTDSKGYNTFGFNVTVINTAPYFTTEFSHEIELPMYQDNIYTFRGDEQNSITVFCKDESNIGTPSYIIVNPDSINIKSTSFSEIQNTHHVEISLKDTQLSSKTQFSVKFTTLAPIFNAPLLNQTVNFNESKIYQLPTFSFKPGNSVTLSLLQAPSFVTLNETALQINPSGYISIGSHTLVLQLTDSENNTSSYTITISIVDIVVPTPPPAIPPVPPLNPPSIPPNPPNPPPVNPPTSPPNTPPNQAPSSTPPISDPKYSSVKVYSLPAFLHPLEPLIIKAGSIHNFTLPNIVDSDNKTVALTIQLADCTPFAIFNSTSNIICFKPQLNNIRGEPYKIKIKVQETYTKREYELKIYIHKSDDSNEQIQQQTNTSNGSNTVQSVELKINEISRSGQIEININSPNQTLSEEIIMKLRDGSLTGQILSENTILQIPIKISERKQEQNIIVGQLIFDSSFYPSTGNDLDKLQLSFKADTDNQNVSFKEIRIVINAAAFIPKQYSQAKIKLLQFIEDAVFYVQTIILPVFILLSLFMPFILQHILARLRDLQFMMMLCLIAMNVPGIVQDYQKKILDIAFLDILYPNLWLMPPLQENDKKPLNEYFLLRGYSSPLVLYNLGSSLIYFGILVLLLVLLIVIKVLANSQILQRYTFIFTYLSRTKCKQQKQWFSILVNASSRLIIQVYSPIILAAVMNLNQFNSVSSEFAKINSVLSLMIISLIHLCLATIFRSIQKTDQNKITQNFTPFIENLNMSKGIISKYWKFLAIARQLVAICIFIVLREYYLLQILALQTISLAMLDLMIFGKPFQEQSDFLFQIFIEMVAQAYLYALLCLTQLQPPINTETRKSIGDFLVAIVTLVLIISVLRILINICGSCRRFWLRKRNQRRRKVIQVDNIQHPVSVQKDETPRFQDNTIVIQPLIEEIKDSQILDQTRNMEENMQNHQEISEEDKEEETTPPRIGWLQAPNKINKLNEIEQQHLELPPISSVHQQSLHTFRINTSLVTISERDMPNRASRQKLAQEESCESIKNSIDFQQ